MNSDPSNSLKDLLNLFSYPGLYPPQQQAVDAGILEGKSMLVTTPTASGKTLIAMMAIVQAIRKGGRAVYLTPLRALASEKYHELKQIERLELGRKVNVRLSTSDYESSGRELVDADVAVMTNEKMDTLFRSGAEWLQDVRLFISDEVHLIGDRERGPTLEMMLARIRKFYPAAQIVALSATIANSKEIAEWLGCTLVESKWRPTALVEGVYESGKIRTASGAAPVASFGETPPVEVALDCIRDGGQSLVFAETRKRAVSLATKGSSMVYDMLGEEERRLAAKVSAEILGSDEDSEMTRTLAHLAAKGAGFHHAGLGPSSRKIMEDSFRRGVIKLLAATPTLAAGVNLPARRVVIASILRYDSDYGTNVPISVLEYKQLCGRAGRPAFDTFGEAVIVASEARTNADELYEHYVLGTPEPIRSQMSSERAIRFHLLSAIAMNPGMKLTEIIGLFSSTLFARQNRPAALQFKIESALDYLKQEELVSAKASRYIATEFGKRVTLLYIDPMTAVDFRTALRGVEKGSAKHTLGILHLLTESSDFFPKLALRRKDYDAVAALLDSRAHEMLKPASEYDVSRSFWALAEWINEATEPQLEELIGVEPGDMYRIVESANWLAYSLREIAKAVQREDLLHEIDQLRTRVRYGVREELLSLVSLDGVGRARARALFDAGFADTGLVAKASESKLASVQKIGPSLAARIKDQLKKRSH